MRKQVSSTFAIVVIVFAIAVGALYFMYQYNQYEAEWQREANMLQMQADTAKRSGRGMMRGRRGGMGGGAAKPGATKSAPKPGAPAAKPTAKPAAEKAAPKPVEQKAAQPAAPAKK